MLLVSPLAGWGPWGTWIYRVLALLVVACPCALVISIPVTIVSALAGAAKRGILIKEALHLENAGRARVRPGAAEALRALHRAGIAHVVMLTGDYEGTARAVAGALGRPGAGVDEYHAELLPEDKTEAVRELRTRYGAVIFVGDGVNDAPPWQQPTSEWQWAPGGPTWRWRRRHRADGGPQSQAGPRNFGHRSGGTPYVCAVFSGMPSSFIRRDSRRPRRPAF